MSNWTSFSKFTETIKLLTAATDTNVRSVSKRLLIIMFNATTNHSNFCSSIIHSKTMGKYFNKVTAADL